MATERGTSVVPVVMGSVGAALQLPGALCGAACAAGISVATEVSSTGDEAGAIFLVLGIIAAIIGLVGGILGKPRPVGAGILLIIATLMTGFLVVMGLFLNFWTDIACILFLIGGIFAFTQKKESTAEAA